MRTLSEPSACFEAILNQRSGRTRSGFLERLERRPRVTASTRSIWQEQTEMVHRRKANLPPRKNFPRNKRLRSAPMKSISSATAPPATRWTTGSAPNGSFSRNPANPPRKPPRPLLNPGSGFRHPSPTRVFCQFKRSRTAFSFPLRSLEVVALSSQLPHPRSYSCE